MKGKLSNYAFILLFIISTLLLIYLSYYFVQESRSKLIERELLSDKYNLEQAVSNIESVIDMLSKHLLVEAEHYSKFELDDENKTKLENSLKIHQPYISSVTRADKNGVILYTVPEKEGLIGQNISHQEHVKKIISDHKPVFSDIFNAVQGFPAIALHAPVMVKGEYNGSLAYLISFDHLSDFLKDKYSRSSDSDIQMILDNSGTIVYSSRNDSSCTDFTGTNDFRNEFTSFLKNGNYSEFRFTINGERFAGRLKKIKLPFDNSWNAFSAVSETAMLTRNGSIPLKFILLTMAIFGLFSLAVIKFRTMYITIRDKEIKENLEKNLASSQKLYKTVITDMNSLICRLDKTKKIIFFNRPFYQKFKDKTKNIMGKDIVEILNEDEAIQLNAKLDLINSKKPADSVEMTVNINGKDCNLFITVRGIFDDSDKINQYQLIATDITEYKESEKKDQIYRDKIKESEKMAALGNLAAGVAHDFNNILMGIQGNTSLLKLKYDKNEEINSRLKQIEDQIKEASSLSRQLLGMAKGGKYEVVKFDPIELVSSIAEVFSQSNKNIVFKKSFCEAKYAVEGDKAQVRQAFANIILNAIQSITDTGNIELSTEFIDPEDDFIYTHGLKKKKYLKFTVKDNGIGMDDEVKSKILDPFFTTRRKGKGSGLGLSSAYGIIRNHEGALEFDSKKFHGSVFKIYLPVLDKEFVTGEPEKDIFNTKNETILIVDDEKMVLNATAEMLSYLGYKVLKAESGKVAIDIFMNTQKISCVILDMILPGMDGEKIFNELIKIDPSVKVIISSGYSMSKKVETMLMKGAKGFLEKPFSIEEISLKLRQILEQK